MITTTAVAQSAVNLGQNHRHYVEVSSTNDVARQLAAKGAPAGTVVTADHQTSGRGRLGRQWVSVPRQGLLMSVIIRPFVAAERLGLITIAAALSVAEVIESVAQCSTQIKWPNDILIGDRKVSGILLESSLQRQGERPDFVVVGIGVNVSQSDFPAEISDRATSLLLETGRHIRREELRDRILESLSQSLKMVGSGSAESLRAKYERRLCGLGEPVELRVVAGGSNVRGILSGVGPDGEILIVDSEGTTLPYYAGDTSMSP